MRCAKVMSIALVTILVSAVAGAAAPPKKSVRSTKSVAKKQQGKVAGAAGKLKKTYLRPTHSVPEAHGVILWDQTDLSTGSASPDQDFETLYDAYDCNAADDFVVPAAGWSIDQVNTLGVYSAGGGPAPDVDVIISADGGGIPGAPMAGCSYASVVPSVDNLGDFTIDLVPACNLVVAGTYWIEVQTNMYYSAGLQHYWVSRSASNGNGGVWQNPGDGFTTGCTAWTPTPTCLATAGPDWCFSLGGVVLPVKLQSFDSE